MKFLCAPDSFKGSLSASDAANAMRDGILQAFPDADVDCCPIADGGEGTARILAESMHGKIHSARVSGPLGTPVDAEFGIVANQGLAVLDMASAAGLGLVPEAQRNVLRATSFGVGELLLAACRSGVQHIVIGVGGSASNDGGCGMAQALGVRFLDARGKPIEVPIGGGDLLNIASIDACRLAKAISLVEITVACDVVNPLTGPNGAAPVYGRQKGANDEQIALLDRGLENLAAVLRRDLGIEVENLPRGGAAGGLAAGLHALAGARLESGIDVVLDAVQFDRRVECAGLCLTGEGRLDGQSLEGKACLGVARRAATAGVPTIALVGSTGFDAEKTLTAGLSGYELIGPGLPAQDSMRRARELLNSASQRVVRRFLRDES